jgi:hypothetical protein
MKSLYLSAVLALGAALAPSAIVVEGAHAAPIADKPINAMCPIGKEPIVPSAGTVEYKGHTIGLCCPSCGKAFMAWDEKRRDTFVALAMRGEEPGHKTGEAQEAPATSQPAAADVAPYPLDVCIVGKGKLGSMGDPVIKQYDGREVRFCCAGCIGAFEADKAGFFKKIDEKIIKDQMRYYPTDRCVVTDEPLTENGKDIATNIVYQERLVRLCCKGCVREFKGDPKTFMAKLDKAVVDAQRKAYPMDTCLVAGSKLGSMGEPSEMIVAGRLMRFCCAGCEPQVKADPAKYLAMVDKAWQARGRFTVEAAKEGGAGSE